MNNYGAPLSQVLPSDYDPPPMATSKIFLTPICFLSASQLLMIFTSYCRQEFYDDGYINNNSFRGYRGLWYHSYGLNSALGYIYLADLWGAKIPKKIIKKLKKAAEVLNLGITDYEKYASRKFDGDQNNNQYKKKNARMHTHQDALAIDTLMEIITGVKLETEAENEYVDLQKQEVDLVNSFKEKYGVGTVDLSSGEFIPAK